MFTINFEDRDASTKTIFKNLIARDSPRPKCPSAISSFWRALSVSIVGPQTPSEPAMNSLASLSPCADIATYFGQAMPMGC
jgi:hypothetical protein